MKADSLVFVIIETVTLIVWARLMNLEYSKILASAFVLDRAVLSLGRMSEGPGTSLCGFGPLSEFSGGFGRFRPTAATPANGLFGYGARQATRGWCSSFSARDILGSSRLWYCPFSKG
ncbi:hypothetical protein B0J12DRAFT_213761 [Macrophomina phaseolina]|uniref:Secreted protein n=1 Tax=Macrophomina phaseolina TaxID=35725 RepID=A0ABQ8G1G5_9PEZI|nr:hypothetical protein B0J12DRAFT_213761 [Macrophomina phaseolina]